MSNDAALARLRIRHDARFFPYSWENEPPLPLAEITRSSANVHLIPSSGAVERELSRVPPGATVTLRGWLVDASAPDGRISRRPSQVPRCRRHARAGRAGVAKRIQRR